MLTAKHNNSSGFTVIRLQPFLTIVVYTQHHSNVNILLVDSLKTKHKFISLYEKQTLLTKNSSRNIRLSSVMLNKYDTVTLITVYIKQQL